MKEVNLIPDDPKSAECMQQLEQVNSLNPSMLPTVDILDLMF